MDQWDLSADGVTAPVWRSRGRHQIGQSRRSLEPSLLVEPGFFRTELLTAASTTYAKPSIDDYAERTKETVVAWNSMNGKQGGDPAKLADAIVQLAGLRVPPIRFAAGVDAMKSFADRLMEHQGAGIVTG